MRDNIITRIASRATQLLRRRTAYTKVFKHENSDQAIYSQIVLTDLRRFCPTDPTLAGTVKDQNEVFINIGRRQVLARIMQMINMSDAKINEIAEAELKERYNAQREW